MQGLSFHVFDSSDSLHMWSTLRTHENRVILTVRPDDRRLLKLAKVTVQISSAARDLMHIQQDNSTESATDLVWQSLSALLPRRTLDVATFASTVLQSSLRQVDDVVESGLVDVATMVNYEVSVTEVLSTGDSADTVGNGSEVLDVHHAMTNNGYVCFLLPVVTISVTLSVEARTKCRHSDLTPNRAVFDKNHIVATLASADAVAPLLVFRFEC